MKHFTLFILMLLNINMLKSQFPEFKVYTIGETGDDYFWYQFFIETV